MLRYSIVEEIKPKGSLTSTDMSKLQSVCFSSILGVSPNNQTLVKFGNDVLCACRLGESRLQFEKPE